MSETNRRVGVLATHIASAPLRSAALVLTTVAALGAAIIYVFGDAAFAERQARNPKVIVEWIGAGVTGIAAIVAAFRIHARGRTPLWRGVPLLLFASWQILSIYGCYDIPVDPPSVQVLFGRSPDCFLFILATSIPLGFAVFFLLGLHRVQLRASVAAMTGLGVSATAIFLLQFFHDFEMNLSDWSFHFLAMGMVVGSSAYAGQLLPMRRL